MNWEGVEGNWKDFQGKVLEQWGKLTSDDLNQVRGRRDLLLGKLQERYGIGREAAERQIDEWVRGIGEHGSMRTAENITKAYEHWFERIVDVQRQSIDLMSARMRKAMELPARFAECRNPADIAEAQAEFASTMVSDYFEAGREMLSVLTAAKKNFVPDRHETSGQQVQRLKGNGGRR
jgi:uncharacterized protein YjbJ (UPF0337 family)